MNKSISTPRPLLVRLRVWTSILIMAPFAAAAALSVPLFRQDSAADALLDLGGWVCFVVGATFRWWATLYVGGRKNSALATDGPYSICRNPLYFGIFSLTLSIAFFIQSLTFAIGLLFAAPIYLCTTVTWEEARLRQIFGESYDEYRKRVPMFFPAISQLETPPVISVNVSGLCKEYKAMLRWIWIPALCQLFVHLRASEQWPALFNLP